MTLLEHLAELRKRLLWAVLGLLMGAIAGWFVFDPLVAFMFKPLAQSGGILSFTTVGAAFDLHLRVALWAGALISAPWWIAQLWLFVAPGLLRREKLYFWSFLGAALVLFAAGSVLGAWTAPRAVRVLSTFTPTGGALLLEADAYLRFYMAVVILFGISALVPLVLVLLNFVGVLSARTILSYWRAAIMTAFTFAAIANPLPGIWSMLVQGLILMSLWGLALGVCFLREWWARRQLRRQAQPV
ncbi:twin arginine-targeting protein translocase TatC [Boudabousia liubingyangii]|uniref:twin-arginine translocase subunit TatC n=1 Tax=Boudabousia liubingyangii TaxID=1921764 RepID=UPI00093D626A|nr:twin-arginine translocase subunit TatC [Boudabousia liubingyangii]OKL46899.1 twin arginine-targeting protein translocase TatC [Boudabousia liubingyangii]